MSAPLARARVYRNIELRQEWLGLELLDWLGLGIVFLVLDVANKGAFSWNVLLLVVLYVGLRLLKRGKPEGHTTALVTFYVLRKPHFSAAANDQKAEPFLVEVRRSLACAPSTQR